jgi:hypothetical protein
MHKICTKTVYFEPSTIEGARKGGFKVEVGTKDKVVIAENK